jgi:flagellar protein FlbD
MIQVTRLNHSCLILNSDLIETIENTPDTVITLVNERRITVTESAEELIERVRAYRRSLFCPEAPHIHPSALERSERLREAH